VKGVPMKLLLTILRFIGLNVLVIGGVVFVPYGVVAIMDTLHLSCLPMREPIYFIMWVTGIFYMLCFFAFIMGSIILCGWFKLNWRWAKGER